MSDIRSMLPQFDWIEESPIDDISFDGDLLERRENGLRHTVGSILSIITPPDDDTLIKSFNELHRPDTTSKLTAGARAYTKHIHRSVTDKFWHRFKIKGRETEENKNKTANKILEYFINEDNRVWQNVHGLPPFDSYLTYTYEIRIKEGYGMRWSYLNEDGSKLKFRGFLEPPCADGHENGWIH